MLPLSSDSSFHYEFLRVLAAAATHGSDVAELLSIAPRLIPGDFETWYVEFEQLAQSVLSSLDPKNSYDKIALRNAYFRASHYFFASDFYLHGNPEDARIQSAYEQWSTLFDKAIALLPFPGERRHVQASGFMVPIIILRPDASSQPRPTLILGNGFDGAMEEMYHVLGAPALERGYNVVLYEGPGQTGVRRTQKIGFRHDWETVVIPVVDLLETLDFVDSKKIVLMGYSMGGYLAARAAAFEHRLAACILVDAMWDVLAAIGRAIPKAVEHYDAGDAAACAQAVKEASQESTNKRWLCEHLVWSFMSSASDAIRTLKKMNVADVMQQVTCPVFVGEALDDELVREQAGRFMKAIPEQAFLFSPGREFAATTHCHVGATFYLAQEVFAWLGTKGLTP